MQTIKQSESTAARRTVYFFAADDDSADSYAPKTALTFAAGELKVSKAGAAEANAAGTSSEIGGGWYAYEFTAGEVDTVGAVMLRTNKTDVYTDAVIVQVVAFDPYDATDLGLSTLDAAVSTRLASASYENTDTFLDKAAGVETGMTVRQCLRLIAAMLGGKVSGGGTSTEVFRNAVADSKARLTFTVDASGNRTSITYDLS